MLKLKADGAIDTTFGQAGVFTSSFGGPENDVANALAVDALGRPIAGGTAGSVDFGALRLTPGGTIDSSFGTGGRARIDFGGRGDQASDITIEPGGRVLMVGSSVSGVATDVRVGIARLLTDGTLDSTFGVGGSALIPLPAGYFGASAVARAVALDRCGAVVVGGWGEEAAAGLSRVGMVRIHR
jgi:uncharacterized delta-60 repeat protein